MHLQFLKGGNKLEAKNLILGLQHLGLPTNCYEETLKFYQLLGFGVQTQEDNRGKRVCFLKLLDMVLEVYESEDCTLQTGAWDHIAINVNDVEATFRFITSTMSIENVTIQTLPFFEKGVRFFTITGPNGERVEFNQYL